MKRRVMMINTVLIITAALLTAPPSVVNEQDFYKRIQSGSISDIEEAMTTIDTIFTTQDYIKLEQISTLSMRKDESYNILKKYIENGYHINTNHRIDECVQEYCFTEQSQKKMLVTYERNHNQGYQWYLKNMQLYENNIEKTFSREYFTPLAPNRYFDALPQNLEKGGFERIFRFLHNGSILIELMPDSNIAVTNIQHWTVKNLIIYNDSDINWFYMTFKQQPLTKQNLDNSGWLLDKMNSMLGNIDGHDLELDKDNIKSWFDFTPKTIAQNQNLFKENKKDMKQNSVEYPVIYDDIMNEVILCRPDEKKTIEKIQTYLKRYGVFDLVIDGIYGSQTRNAILSFNSKQKNIHEMNSYFKLYENNNPEIDNVQGRNDLRQVNMKKLQHHLNNLGFNPGKIDGTFGRRTQHALNQFRKKYGITSQNGFNDKETLDALYSVSADIFE
jgi:hypothetical protein